MKDFRTIIADGDLSQLDREDYLNEALYDALIDVYCEKSGTSWVAITNKMKVASSDYGTDTKVAVREFITEAKKQLPARRETLKRGTSTPTAVVMDTNKNPLGLSEPELARAVCLNYEIDENGIYEITNGGGRKLFCHTPLAVTMEFISAEGTGTYYNIVYLRITNGKREVCNKIYPAETISNKNQILKLARDGILVNTNNAASLVDYITECIAAGQQAGMPAGDSISRFGWMDDGRFSPYDDGIMFDGEDRFFQLLEAVKSVKGDPDEYMRHMREIRAMGRLEINVCISAAMASIMLGQYIEALPPIIHIIGDSDSGKSLALRYALSQIGDPMEGALMGDYRGSKAGIEARAGCLHSLPLALDDISKLSADTRKNLESLVYDLCAGEGRTLGSRDGGNRAIKKWNCFILSTGEDRISSYCQQGGGLNRVIEITAGEGLAFPKPERNIHWLKRNHGHIIRPFIKLLRELGEDKIMEIYERNKDMIKQHLTDNVLAKQLQPLTIILAADEILADYIYRDGVYLRDHIDELAGMLKTENQVSDGARAYETLKDLIAGNSRHFYMDDPLCDEAQGEQWGWTTGSEDYVFITGTALKQMLGREGYNSRKFIAWAIKQGITEADRNGNAPVHHLRTVAGKGEQKRAWKIKIAGESRDTTGEKIIGKSHLQRETLVTDEELPWV